jgi:hypothetical protein
MYTCELCGYSTKRNSNLERHKSRNKTCVNNNTVTNGNDIDTTDDINDKNPTINEDIILDADAKKILDADAKILDADEDALDILNADENVKIKCRKCFKHFSKRYVKTHERRCDGLDYKQCKICLKMFTSGQGKYHHNKKVKCNPPITLEELHLPNQQVIHNQTNNNNNSNNNSNNNTNNSHNSTINININAYGKEDLEYLLKDEKFIQKCVSYGKKGIYGIADMLKDVHCNGERPENNNIIKPLENGKGVYIMGDDKEWEYREFEDVRNTLVDNATKCIEKYEELRASMGIK